MLKENSFSIFLIVFFLGLTGWYLYPTAQNIWLNRQMGAMDAGERALYERENHARLQEIQARSLRLGLDLQGGMHVVLEVRVSELIDLLAENQDEQFEEVLRAATRRAQAENRSLVDVFVEEFEARDPDVRLARYFRSEEAGITRRSSNAEVRRYLERESDRAVERAIEVVRKRVDRYGVTEPSIRRQGTQRAVVELPGVDEPERVRDLLRGAARLEFRLMANPADLAASAERIVAYYDQMDVREPVDPLPTPDAEAAPSGPAAGARTALNGAAWQ